MTSTTFCWHTQNRPIWLADSSGNYTWQPAPLANQVDEVARLPLGQQKKSSKGTWTDKSYDGLMGGRFHLISLHINKLWRSKHAPNNSPLANNKLRSAHWMIQGCGPTGPVQLEQSLPELISLWIKKQINCQDVIGTREAREWFFFFSSPYFFFSVLKLT